MSDPASCSHPVQVAGLCAICGVEVDSSQSINGAAGDGGSTSTAGGFEGSGAGSGERGEGSSRGMTMHELSGIKVSTAEAQRLDDESRARLLEQRKLALIVDLDQTIIHATVEPTVGDWMRDRNNPNFEALKNVGTFRLGTDGKAILGHDDGRGSNANGSNGGNNDGESSTSEHIRDDEGCWYYVKPRPGLQDFLRTLSKSYEMHVYTMGTRSYAECVCRLVDPDGSLFGARILSRDENGSMLQKSLKKLFPLDTTMVVIIDDRADVWKWSPNLVKVVPFDFFVGIGDINATFLPAAPSVPAPTTFEGLGSGADVVAATDEQGTAASPSSPADSPDATSSSPSSSTNAASSSSSATSLSPASSAEDSSVKSERRASNATTENQKPGESASQTDDDIAAKEVADRSQKSAVSAQLAARHLAKMQEALDEKMSDGTTEKASENRAASPLVNEEKTPDPTPSPDPVTASHQSPQQQQQQQRAVLRDDDEELDRIHGILGEIHSQWYKQWETSPESADMKVKENRSVDQTTPATVSPAVTDILADLKRRVLVGCKIVFSSIVPLETDPIGTDLWRLALEFGATCTTDMESGGVTHVVAAKPGTMKVWMGQKQGLNVVWPAWLHDSAARWSRQPEAWYALQVHQSQARLRQDDKAEVEKGIAADVDDDDGEEEDDDDNADGVGPQNGQTAGDEEQEGFQSMDWKEAMDEVDEVLAGLTDDDDDDQTTDGGYSSTAGMRTPVRSSAKRLRDDGDAEEDGLGTGADSEVEDGGDESEEGVDDDEHDDDATRSPLGKRRRLAELRAGHSKLKMQLHTRDSSRSETPREGGKEEGSGAGGQEEQEQGGNQEEENFLKSLEEELEMQIGKADEVTTSG